MKIKRPGDGRCQGDNPNKEDDESGTTSGDLKTHGETDGQNPGETKKKHNFKLVLVYLVALFSTRLIVSWQHHGRKY